MMQARESYNTVRLPDYDAGDRLQSTKLYGSVDLRALNVHVLGING